MAHRAQTQLSETIRYRQVGRAMDTLARLSPLELSPGWPIEACIRAHRLDPFVAKAVCRGNGDHRDAELDKRARCSTSRPTASAASSARRGVGGCDPRERSGLDGWGRTGGRTPWD